MRDQPAATAAEGWLYLNSNRSKRTLFVSGSAFIPAKALRLVEGLLLNRLRASSPPSQHTCSPMPGTGRRSAEPTLFRPNPADDEWTNKGINE
jgi:hypothetical protein